CAGLLQPARPGGPAASIGLRRAMRPSPYSCGLGLRGYPFRGHLAFTCVTARRLAPLPRRGLSMGFRSVGFPPACHPATGLPIVTPTGLTPAGHSSLSWTHNLYGELLDLLGQSDPCLRPEPPSLYAAACRLT